MKKHNFNAGPSILADEVIENAAKAVLDFNGSGLSVLSISHRSKEFDAVMEEADRLFRELLAIPDNYRIVYLGGGASTLFYEVAANFLGRKAGYVNTGVWSKKAIKEAKRYGEVEVVASSEDRNFTYIPKGFAVPADLDYLHITSNNTIYGTEYHEDISSPVPLIADMSSDILSRPVDVSKYAMIYGGAQKNLAPAGVAFAIIREDMLDRIVRDLPTMVSFRTTWRTTRCSTRRPSSLSTYSWRRCAGSSRSAASGKSSAATARRPRCSTTRSTATRSSAARWRRRTVR